MRRTSKGLMVTSTHKPTTSNSKEINTNLSKMTEVEINEFCERQRNILANSTLVARLADNGDKVREKLRLAERELARRTEVANVADLMDELSIRSDLLCEVDKASPSEVERSTNEEHGGGLHLPKYAEKLSSRLHEEQESETQKFYPHRSLKHSAQVKPETLERMASFAGLETKSSSKSISLSLKESVELARANATRLRLEQAELASEALLELRQNAASSQAADEDSSFQATPREGISGESFLRLRDSREKRAQSGLPGLCLDSDDDESDQDNDTNVGEDRGGALEEVD